MYWITGSRGLLGSALSAKCKAALHTGREVDIADLKSIREFLHRNRGITHILNCAAFSEVDGAETRREEAYRTNALGPLNLAIGAKDAGVKLVHISTDYVFPGNGFSPLKESDPVGPVNYYGETKLEGEARALEHGACVIRTSWIFGRGGKNFVSKLLKMLQTEKEIKLTRDQRSRFTYAPDLGDAILKMLDQSGLYQFANQGVTTKYEFALAMREEAILLGFPVTAENLIPVPASFFPSPCKRPPYSAFDTTKIESHLTIRHWREPLKELLCEQLPAYL